MENFMLWATDNKDVIGYILILNPFTLYPISVVLASLSKWGLILAIPSQLLLSLFFIGIALGAIYSLGREIPLDISITTGILVFLASLTPVTMFYAFTHPTKQNTKIEEKN
jgi:hypothetical protein